MTVWILFRDDNVMEIRNVEYYDAGKMDGFIRIKVKGSSSLICLAESETKMIGEKVAIFGEHEDS